MEHIKISKKLERLSRALLARQLWRKGFPERLIHSRVEEGWPCMIQEAKDINLFLNLYNHHPLDGETTQEEIDKWSEGADA